MRDAGRDYTISNGTYAGFVGGDHSCRLEHDRQAVGRSYHRVCGYFGHGRSLRVARSALPRSTAERGLAVADRLGGAAQRLLRCSHRRLQYRRSGVGLSDIVGAGAARRRSIGVRDCRRNTAPRRSARHRSMLCRNPQPGADRTGIEWPAVPAPRNRPGTGHRRADRHLHHGRRRRGPGGDRRRRAFGLHRLAVFVARVHILPWRRRLAASPVAAADPTIGVGGGRRRPGRRRLRYRHFRPIDRADGRGCHRPRDQRHLRHRLRGSVFWASRSPCAGCCRRPPSPRGSPRSTSAGRCSPPFKVRVRRLILPS